MNKLHSQRWKKSCGAAPTKYPLYLPTEAELKHELERMKNEDIVTVFKKEGINVMDESFLASQAYLQQELADMENDAVMINEKVFWQNTEDALCQ